MCGIPPKANRDMRKLHWKGTGLVPLICVGCPHTGETLPARGVRLPDQHPANAQMPGQAGHDGKAVTVGSRLLFYAAGTPFSGDVLETGVKGSGRRRSWCRPFR